jgi:hypothetical protein
MEQLHPVSLFYSTLLRSVVSPRPVEDSPELIGTAAHEAGIRVFETRRVMGPAMYPQQRSRIDPRVWNVWFGLGTIDRGDPISASIFLIVWAGYYWFPIGLASAVLYTMIVHVLQLLSVRQRIVSAVAAAGIVGSAAFATGFIEMDTMPSPVALWIALPYAFAMAAAAFADPQFKRTIWEHSPRFGTPRNQPLAK